MKQRAPVLFSLLLLLGAVPGAALQQEAWTSRYPLAATGEVTVANVQGSIEVEGWDRPEVELVAVKTAGDAASLDEAAVVVEPRGNSLRVRTFYSGRAETPMQVDYHLRVPRQARLAGLRTINGDIVVRDVEGALEAHTLNGDIEQTGAADSVLAQTVNGSVRVSLRMLPGPEGRLQLETVNGDVTLRLPPAANADLELSTVAGKIDTGLLYHAAAAGDNRLHTRLGRGGLPVRLKTIRGSIRLSVEEDML